jgi:hypothetical protein
MSRCEVMCDVDIEQSFDSFHAHAIPDVEINPGDVVILRDAPDVGFGETYTGRGRALLIRAGRTRRMLTRLASIFALSELYEVGFQAIDVKG